MISAATTIKVLLKASGMPAIVSSHNKRKNSLQHHRVIRKISD
jgi:hypothetical protein